MLKITTLKGITFKQITNTFNLAFSDFSPPIIFTEEKFKNKFDTEGGRLDLSVGVFDNENLVGFILHFLGQKNGENYVYNGGTGVIADYRGNKLTTQMYEFILPILKKEKLDKMILEVFTENFSAQKIYTNLGFRIQREVNCYNGMLIPQNQSKLKKFKVIEIEELNWDKLKEFWDYEPTWQNSISTLNNLSSQNLAIGININDELKGYLIYNPKFKRINQMAIDKNFRNLGIGSHLINYIANIESQKISFINIDSRIKHFNNFLEKRGLKNYINQYEMIYPIK